VSYLSAEDPVNKHWKYSIVYYLNRIIYSNIHPIVTLTTGLKIFSKPALHKEGYSVPLAIGSIIFLLTAIQYLLKVFPSSFTKLKFCFKNAFTRLFLRKITNPNRILPVYYKNDKPDPPDYIKLHHFSFDRTYLPASKLKIF
jgi:hypothetical protein